MMPGSIWTSLVLLMCLAYTQSQGKFECPEGDYEGDDLNQLDFLNHFGFDGVKKEEGFGKHGVSFHVTSKSVLTDEPNWMLFKDGLPQSFVFVATFKTFSRKPTWKIFDIKEPGGDTQLALLFYGRRKQASLVYRDINRDTKIVNFAPKIGKLVTKTKEWHKIYLRIIQGEQIQDGTKRIVDIVTIDVDCRLTDKQVLDTPREPNMNLNGYTSIGRDIDGKKIRFKVQWMEFHCNPYKEKTCKELNEANNVQNQLELVGGSLRLLFFKCI